MNREAVAEGRPKLSLTEEQREVLAEMLAELLLEALAGAAPAEAAG
jgi:hypothetical protein